MSAKFDEFLSLPFHDIEEKPKNIADEWKDRREDSVTPPPPTNIVCRGIIIIFV